MRVCLAENVTVETLGAEQYVSDVGPFAREAEVDLLIESAKRAGLAACLTADQLQKRPDTKRLKACDSERARS